MSDTFIVNDNDEAGNVTTKVISAPNLAADIGGKININELLGVSLDNPQIGNVIKWNGTAWVPAQDLVGEGGSGIALTDLNAVTATTGVGSGSLTYNNLQGIFTYTPPLMTLENLDNVNEQVPVTGEFLRWGGSYWYPSSIDDTALIVQNAENGSGVGSIGLAGDVLTYTPPDFTSYLTAESDPIFSASAASAITYQDITNWNQLLIDLGEEQTLNDLADVATNGFTPADGMVLTYDSETGIWYPKAVPAPALGDLKDVYTAGAEANDIIKFDGAQWRAQPNPSNQIEAGPGLYGGGTGAVVLGVNTGRGISIVNDAVQLDASLNDLSNVFANPIDGSVLMWRGGGWIASESGGDIAGSVKALNDLSDVSTAQADNGRVLTYVNGTWVARDPAAGGGAINVQVWGHLEKIGSASDNNFQIAAGSNNFTFDDRRSVTGGYGRVKITFNNPPPNKFYITHVTTIDGEGDHFAGVTAQGQNSVIIFAKDLENAGTNDDGDSDPGDVSSLMFTCSW